MKRPTKWIPGFACLIIGGYFLLLSLHYSQTPSEFWQLRTGLSKQEASAILNGQFFPVLCMKRQDSQLTGKILGTEWIRHGTLNKDIHLQKYIDKLAEGQAWELWDHDGEAIILIFSEDDELLEKELFPKQGKPYSRRLLDLIW